LYSRPCLGIYLGDKLGQSGPGRYIRGIIEGLKQSEFDAVVFCTGLIGDDPEVPIVSTLGQSMQPSSGKDARSGSRDLSSNRRRAKQFWQRVAPLAVRYWGGVARETYNLAHLFRRHSVDLLHTNNTGCEESPLAARLAGIRRILGTFHVESKVSLNDDRDAFRYRALECISNHCLNRAIAVSDAAGRDWIARTRLPASRVTTIYNGVDPERFRRRRSRIEARQMLGLPVGALMIGSVGRLDPVKGFSYLLEAAASLIPEYPNLLLAVAGTGPSHRDLLNDAERLGISNHVRWLGFCSDVNTVYDALDLFVLPSLRDALPYALIEAMAHELPAIGTSVGGIPEIIEDQETGLLVPPRQVADLARALRLLLASPERRIRMGGAARARVLKHFCEADCVRKTIQLYRAMVRY